MQNDGKWARTGLLSAVLVAISSPVALAHGGGEGLEQRVQRLEKQLAASRVASHVLPEEVSLLGRKLPLYLHDVRERLEREFYVALSDRATLVLWQKRAARYFPLLERAIRAADLPEDLKYVAVIESGLKPNAKSWAGAVGPWQFMPATAGDYDLRVKNGVDDRRDFSKSTAAAMRYFRALHRRFEDWPLSLAAYNCGPGRVRKSLAAQGVSSYWDLRLPNEAQRYVARVAVVRLILSNPKRYGIDLDPATLYSPRPVVSWPLHVKAGRVQVLGLARAAGTTYRQIRELNPWITEAWIGAGKHTLWIPKQAAEDFGDAVSLTLEDAERAAKRATARARAKKKSAKKATAEKRARAEKKARADRKRREQRQRKARAKKPTRSASKRKAPQKSSSRHTVRRGESLWDVARKHGTTVAALTRTNRLRNSARIYPGQVLRLR